MTTSSKSNMVLPPGALITGRWRGGRYVIQRLLGQGANGIVYLVKRAENGELYALKMGFDTIDIQSEVNVLKALHNQRRKHRKADERQDPSYLVEVDDYSHLGREIPFYVMRYVRGEPLRAFLLNRGDRWLNVAGLYILQQLRRLHESGWVFGDLKPDNVLISPYGEVELIDYGGVSAIGRSVKQFTEWYDRGYWSAGSRTADPAYDLFSFAVVCIHMLAEEPLKKAATSLPQTRSKNDLLHIIQTEPALRPYQKWLEKAIEGKFGDSAEACDLWKELVKGFMKRGRPQTSTPGWMLGAFALSITLLVCALYLTLRF